MIILMYRMMTIYRSRNRLRRKCSVPLFGKEGLGEILLNKSPSIPLLQRGIESLPLDRYCKEIEKFDYQGSACPEWAQPCRRQVTRMRSW